MKDDEAFKRWWARRERLGASPAGVIALMRMNSEISVEGGRALAELIPQARLLELPGEDHLPYLGDNADRIVDEIEEFVTGSRAEIEPDRVLATVLFTDLVNSTERATALGDRAWRALLDRHDALVRREFREWALPARVQPALATRVLVTVGGSDPRNATSALLRALALFERPALAVRVVVGPANPWRAELEALASALPLDVALCTAVTDMPTLMSWAHVALTGAGTTCWELACMGVPMLTLTVAASLVSTPSKLSGLTTLPLFCSSMASVGACWTTMRRLGIDGMSSWAGASHAVPGCSCSTSTSRLAAARTVAVAALVLAAAEPSVPTVSTCASAAAVFTIRLPAATMRRPSMAMSTRRFNARLARSWPVASGSSEPRPSIATREASMLRRSAR